MATNELAVRYSKLIDKRLRAELLFKVGVTCNNRYEGDPKAGAVKIPVRPEAAVASYNKASGGALNVAGTTYKDILISSDLYVNELIDGYDAAAVPDDIVADRLDSAAYSLAHTIQKTGIAKLEATSTVADSQVALTKDTVYKEILLARTELSNNKVPTNGRVLFVSPDTYALLLQDPNFIRQANLSQEMLNAGAIGMVAGFTVFECVDFASTTEFIAYHPDWFTFINEWSVPVHVQDLNGSGKYIGASAVQGRKISQFELTENKACYIKKNAA